MVALKVPGELWRWGDDIKKNKMPMKVLTSFVFPLPLDIPVANACGYR